MNLRTMAATIGLCLTVLTAGCATSVAGQARIASGAVLPTTSSVPSPFPDPTGSGPSGESTTSGDSSETSTGQPTGSQSTSVQDSTAMQDSTAVSQNQTVGSSSTQAGDSSVGPTSATSIAGLSKDCNTVYAAIPAFGRLLEGAGSSDKISQATVDEILGQLPASGLPTRPQADVTVLRNLVAGAAGKTVGELGATFTDGKVVDALKDLSSWAQDNCS